MMDKQYCPDCGSELSEWYYESKEHPYEVHMVLQCGGKCADEEGLSGIEKSRRLIGTKPELDEIRTIINERPEVISLFHLIEDGISPEDMAKIIPAMEAQGISPDLIEAIKLFEK